MEKPDSLIVLRPEVTRNHVRRMEASRDWDIRDVRRDDGAEGYRRTLRPGDIDAWAYYLEDPVLEMNYFVCKGAEAAAAARQIGEDLAHYSESDLDGEPGSAAEWKVRLGLLAILRQGDFDERVFRQVLAGFHHRTARIRSQAVYAVTYLPWPAFIDPLAELVRKEPKTEVREEAEFMLNYIRQAQAAGKGKG